MRLIVFILFLSFSLTLIQSQNQALVFQEFIKTSYEVDPDSVIDKQQNLPSDIQDILTDFLSQRMGVYYKDLLFHCGYIYDLESIARTKPDVLSRNRKSLSVIPQYDLKYIFKNEEIGIQQYWVNVQLDKYGQILDFNFPEIVRREFKIIPFKEAKVTSDSLLLDSEKYLKDVSIKADLIYEQDKEILTWQICYLRLSEQNSKDYLCFIINAHDGSFIRKEGMTHVRWGDCCNDCEEQPVNILLH